MKNLTSLIALSVILLWTSPVSAKVYHTRDEALAMAFPGADGMEKKTVFLDDEEKKKVEVLARAKLDSRILTFHIGKKGNNILGYALLGSHIVRTKPEVYMVVINPDGSLKRVEILAFYEPEEYLPTRRWFDRFAGKVLDDIDVLRKVMM